MYPFSMNVVLVGAIAGLLHVFAGPDHLAALAPLSLRHPRGAVWTGAAWGAGHGAGVVLLGGLGIIARGAVRLDLLASRFEAVVGVVLLAIGLWAIRTATRLVVHTHPHAHGKDPHAHAHVHLRDAAHGEKAHDHHTHAAFGVGLIHGAAGAGHLLGVLPSLVLARSAAAAYLGAYLVAATIAMAAFGLVLGRVAAHGGARLLRGAMVACGGLSCSIGIAWIVRSW
jgi:hypothetical protein